MDLDLKKYIEKLKETKNLIPCIKKFNKEEIKINEKYIDVENMSEKDILLGKDKDIKSLEKSLEISIDKSFNKYYEKTCGKSNINEYNNISLNDLSSNDLNESNNKNDNKDKNLLKKEESIEEINKENEEYEIGDIKEINLLDDEEEQSEEKENILIYNKKI